MDTSLEFGSIGVGFAIPADTASGIATKPWPPHQHEAGTGRSRSVQGTAGQDHP